MDGNKANILGVNLNSTSASSVLNTIVDRACAEGNLVVFTPNPEFIVEAQADPGFRELLNKADINLPDGFGLVLAGKILNQDVGVRVSGADVVECLLKEGNKNKWTIGIAGARGGVLEEADQQIKNLQAKYPNVFFINLNSKFNILNSKFNVVLACHGMKKQEKWIWENKDKIAANVFMGVGGSLDFLAGFTRRAPAFMRSLGLEWLWRGLQRPKHFKRIWRATAVFGYLVLRKKLNRVFRLDAK